MSKDSVKRRAAVENIENYYPPEESLGFLIREIYRAQSRLLQARISREGVSIGMWFVLRILWEEDGLSQSELSGRVGINGPTAVISLNAMEKAGVVKRVPNQDDRRKTNIFLTEHGRSLKERLWPMALEVNSLATNGMSKDDIRALSTLLAKMRINLNSAR